MIRLLLSMAALLAAASPSAPRAATDADAPAGQCRTGELVNRFGDWRDFGVLLGPSDFPKPLSLQSSRNDVASVRLQFARVEGGASDWQVAIYDDEGHLATIIDGAALPGDGSGVWTSPLPGARFTLELPRGAPQTQVELRAATAFPERAEAVAFSAVDGSEAPKPLYPTSSALERRAGAKVGMLTSTGVVAGEGATLSAARRNWCCSGVMVGRDLFLTNWHCGGARSGMKPFDGETRSAAIVDLGWENGGTPRPLAVEKVEISDERLDFAVLRLRAPAGRDFGPPSSLTAAIGEHAEPGDAVFLVHHAMCRPKLVSRRCSVAGRRRAWTDPANAMETPDLAHDCASEAGASGGALFASDGRLIGLHHLGFSSGPACFSERLNRAVGMGPIASLVRAKIPKLGKELGW